ncbi:unnamed protein product, partial [Meganyctiphanes norvegica]
ELMEDNQKFPFAQLFNHDDAIANFSLPSSLEALNPMNARINSTYNKMIYLEKLGHLEDQSVECIDLNDGAAEETVKLIYQTGYYILGSLLIILGILTNGLCIIVTSRKKLQRMHVTRYIRLLASTDLIGYLAFIPCIVQPSFCVFESYSLAFYNAHFGLMFVSFTRSLSFFIIIWISYDRCLAVWKPGRYKSVNTPKVLRIRAIGTFIFCLFGYAPLMAMGELKSEVIC